MTLELMFDKGFGQTVICLLPDQSNCTEGRLFSQDVE